MENRKDKALEELQRQANISKLKIDEHIKNANKVSDEMYVDYKIKTSTPGKIINKDDITPEIIDEIADDIRSNLDNLNQFHSNDINNKFGISDIDYEETKMNVRKLKKRSFLPAVVGFAIVATLVASTISRAKADLELTKEERFVKEMAIEAEIHGGKKNTIDDEYIYDLEKHIESGDCLIQGDGFARDRIIDTCVEHELSEEVTEAIVDKFNLNYTNKYKEAEKIDPLKIYQEEQKELKEQNNSYGM